MMLKASVSAIVRWISKPFRNGTAPFGAQPCCHEAAYRLFGGCGEGCCGDSQIQGFVEDWAERSRDSRINELKTPEGRR
ncbi:MAG: hypothetical protein KI785_06615 [Devosiaceae bacterium]|nr:hypothetical protein [Devosiaceae bacterium MH13]